MTENRTANDTQMPVPYGIDADTGQPLPGVTPELIAGVTDRLALGDAPVAKRNKDPRVSEFSAIEEVDTGKLDEAGWAILFSSQENHDPIIDALRPLLDKRRKEAGHLYKEFLGPDGYRPSDTADTWLARRGLELGLVNPNRGVPYYILIVGSPERIPMDFQYHLDLWWAPGRLDFSNADGSPDLEAYKQYAENVVAYEVADRPLQTREAVIFAPQNEGDMATPLFRQGVANPLIQGADGLPPVGTKQGFHLHPLLGEAATKANLTATLRRPVGSAPPAILFSGSHGMAFRADDVRLPNYQGALVCQDWPGPGSGRLTQDHYFAFDDIPDDANIQGLIYFMFACYGGGVEKLDTFRTGPGGTALQIAPCSMTARLPQALLGRKKGALAIIAHIDRAWAYSFQGVTGGRAIEGFRDVLVCLMEGQRVGEALDKFNHKWAALSTQLADILRDFKEGTVDASKLANCWIARDDARNYTIFGDPSVQLRPDLMLGVTSNPPAA
jgi:hypothetical protein